MLKYLGEVKELKYKCYIFFFVYFIKWFDIIGLIRYIFIFDKL